MIQPGSIFKTLAFKLTITYSAILFVLSCVGFGFLYLWVNQHIQATINEELHEDFDEFNYVITTSDKDYIRDFFEDEYESDDPVQNILRYSDSSGFALLFYDDQTWPLDEIDRLRDAAERDGQLRMDMVHTIEDQHPARMITGALPNGGVLQIGILIDEEMLLLSNIRLYSVLILFFMLIVGVLVGWNVSRIAVKGINNVTDTANEIAEGQIEKRVTVSKYGREIENLGKTFNRMAGKVTSLLNEMKEVNDNIAHDLRSPLARMRGIAEETLTQKDISEDAISICENVIEECDILLHIINTMLDISELESNLVSLDTEEFDLSAILTQAVETFQPVAEDKNVTFISDIQGTAHIVGDRRKIQRSISNLIDNSLKYTKPGGDVVVGLKTENGMAHIIVKDSGIGIADADKHKIFHRFYRCSKSRTLPGNGLGLSLAISVAHAHGGTINVDSSEGNGSSFTFSLPVALHT